MEQPNKTDLTEEAEYFMSYCKSLTFQDVGDMLNFVQVYADYLTKHKNDPVKHDVASMKFLTVYSLFMPQITKALKG